MSSTSSNLSSESSVEIGKRSAKVMLTVSAQMMITNPLGTRLNTGTNSKRHERIMLPRTQMRIGRSFFTTGTRIAINIAYMDTPRVSVKIGGRKLPASAPMNVPRVQPKIGRITRETRNLLPSVWRFPIATANISSVRKNE